MSRKRFLLIVLAVVFFVGHFAFSQTLQENWEDFLHYMKIGQFEMAKGHAQAVIKANPDPVKLLEFIQENPQGYELLLRISDSEFVPDELAELNKQILELIEKARFKERTSPSIIVAEIKRLNSTDRARITAVNRLKNAGEYAIPHMLEAIASSTGDKSELVNILWALPQIGRDAIRPLAAALQTNNLAVKAEIIKALGKIGYPQALAYLKYVIEKDSSAQLRDLAKESISQIEPAADELSAAQLFYKLAGNYYYRTESLAPAEDAEFANIWFWDIDNRRLISEKVDKNYFYDLMAMHACEWSLKADPAYGKAIGLWLAAYFKAESANVQMPKYFGDDHAEAIVYATTAGPEYLHQALERAIKDKDAYVALGVVEALAITAGEKSLFYSLGVAQPLVQALSFEDKAVKYSAAIAIAQACPQREFFESELVIENLAQALGMQNETAGNQISSLWNDKLMDSYALRAVMAMLKLAQTRNAVINLSAAQNTLISATEDTRAQIQMLAGEVLAYLRSPDAQRAIAKMALQQSNSKEIRISAFNSLAVSAKLNANLLDDESINAIYDLFSSKEVDSDLQRTAASAYGALNLPSPKVKELILEQARS
ncbi:MAG: HEAT repeat domain-containing protein [Planctomycetota bacterium]